MNVVGIIQARMGSTRLPGKVMLPLDCHHVLTHVVRRVAASKSIDETAIATSNDQQDEIVERYGLKTGTTVYRGAEFDVLGRLKDAAVELDADIIVRITADCPLVTPTCIDTVVNQLIKTKADYVSNILYRTVPHGLDAEAFTINSFERVENQAKGERHREHVTLYYREHTDQFKLGNVTAREMFEEHFMHNRTDLRLTLDEAADYELLKTVYENISYDSILDVRDAVLYIDEHNLTDMNADVRQKTL